MLAAVLWIAASAGHAYINPNFTPRHLVDQSEVVAAGVMQRRPGAEEWQLKLTLPIKGKSAPACVLSVARCNKDQAADIEVLLAGNGDAPVLLSSAKAGDDRKAYLHVSGVWLALNPGDGENTWDILGYSTPMTGTYAGGTDQLIRLCQYLAKNPDADVPVAADIAWSEDRVKVGKIEGVSSGLTVIEVGKERRACVFCGSAGGDRLFRPARADGITSFSDVTTPAGLRTRSRAFAWFDANSDGLADLFSWDGKRLSIILAGNDGSFRAQGEYSSAVLDDGLTGFEVCSPDGKPGVLLSGPSSPIWLTFLRGGGWRKTPLPKVEAGNRAGAPSPCVAADFDNDGLVDVLQPAERGGLLWKGLGGGFAPPVAVDLCSGGGLAKSAVADYNEDGYLDVFLAGQEKNTLWENDGKGNFREVLRYAGSISYKCPAPAADVQSMDLNHDGRADVCLVYADSEILYHFNRGFRSFGEEGEVRLSGFEADPGQSPVGQVALAAGDLDGTASQDLVVLLKSGAILAYLNERFEMPGLHLRLPKGVAGPVTVICWENKDGPARRSATRVLGHSPPAYVALRRAGPVTVKWAVAGKDERTKPVTVETRTVELVLD